MDGIWCYCVITLSLLLLSFFSAVSMISFVFILFTYSLILHSPPLATKILGIKVSVSTSLSISSDAQIPDLCQDHSAELQSTVRSFKYLSPLVFFRLVVTVGTAWGQTGSLGHNCQALLV